MSGSCRQCFKRASLVYAGYATSFVILDCGIDYFKGNKLTRERIIFNAFLALTWPVSVPLCAYIFARSYMTGESFSAKWKWSKTIVENKD